jgi:photosystem II stability/assembly factor-like uncharacterized protein
MKKNYKSFLLFVFFIFTPILFNGNLYAQRWILAGSIPNPGPEPNISIVDDNNVWIAGGVPDTPSVYRTINGGLNWIQVPVTGISHQINCVWAFDANTVFVGEGVVSGNARLFKTTNAGINWTIILQTSANQGYFNSLVFSQSNPLVGGVMSDKLFFTTNGGLNWSIQTTGGSGAHNSLMLIDENFYGFGMTNGASRVKVTTNGGILWNNQSLNLTGSNVGGFAYKNDKLTGLASTSTSMPLLSRTINGGITWTSVNIGDSLTGNTIINWVSGTDVVYVAGSNGAIKRSLNNGLSWSTFLNSGIIGLAHMSIKKLNDVIHGYIVSSNGTVIKFADSALVLTGNTGNNQKIPNDFKLFQNYPNPFNPATKIKFDISKTGDRSQESEVKLVIYDILGKEIQTLVNEKLNPGTYEVKWDGSNNANGIYFYKLIAGNYIAVKRMMLIK